LVPYSCDGWPHEVTCPYNFARSPDKSLTCAVSAQRDWLKPETFIYSDTSAMLLEFCQRHFVLLSVVLGLLFSYIRRHSKLTNKDVNAVQSKRAAIEQLDIKSLRKLHTESKAAGYGGKTDLYTWKQSDSEVEVFIDLDKTESKNDIECALTHNTLTVSRSGKCFVQGTFYKAVDPHESVWQFGGSASPCGYYRTNYQNMMRPLLIHDHLVENKSLICCIIGMYSR